MKNLSLRAKIFIAMISIVLISLVLMAIVTILHYKNENQQYHFNRIERKEQRIINHISIILEENNITNKDLAIEKIKSKIQELSLVHNMSIHIYQLNGTLFASSDSLSTDAKLEKEVFENLLVHPTYIRNFGASNILAKTNLLSYSYIDFQNEHILILYLPYTEENTIFRTELENLLIRFFELYILILLSAVIVAYFVSRNITHSLRKISSVLNQTDLKSNSPFEWNSDDEIGKLVTAYNEMINKLALSKEILVKNEKESAWKEMAKQVAHEIKNPLTPMKLEVQLLQRNARKMEDEEEKKKIIDFTRAMLLQIDSLSRIANEFSNFAKMPDQTPSKQNLSDFLTYYSKMHEHSNVVFNICPKSIYVTIDEKQFGRVLNNIIRNAKQSIPQGVKAQIEVNLKCSEHLAIIEIIDNGVGIDESQQQKIFDPQFTTKSAGMGLGLSISKSIVEAFGGRIWLESKVGSGSKFYIELPINPK